VCHLFLLEAYACYNLLTGDLSNSCKLTTVIDLLKSQSRLLPSCCHTVSNGLAKNTFAK